MNKVRAVLEEFGRNSDDGECSYCPSISEDCVKCKKMITTLTHLDALYKAKYLGMLPEKRITCVRRMESCGECHQCLEDKSFNSAIRDVKRRVG